MRKLSFFLGAAALMLIGISTWTVLTTHARAASVGVDPLAIMMSAKDLPTSPCDDYSVVFN
jgi:hypothetical protein